MRAVHASTASLALAAAVFWATTLTMTPTSQTAVTSPGHAAGDTAESCSAFGICP